MKYLFIIAFIFILIAFATADDEETTFSFREFLIDKTDYFGVQISTPNKDGSILYDPEQPLRQLYFTAQDNSTSLKCVTYFNNTKLEPEQQVSDIVHFMTTFDETKNNTGVFQFKDQNKSISFAFTSVNKVAIANGQLDTNTNFQLLVPGPDRFILTLFDAKSGSIQQVYVAKKVLIVIPKTFFQSYGSYIMMFVMLGMNLWLQGKKDDQEEPTEATTPQVQGPQQPPQQQSQQSQKKSKTKKD